MPTNFELKRLKLKLDIVKKPENRVHELPDSNVSRAHDPIKYGKSGAFGLAKSNKETLVPEHAGY